MNQFYRIVSADVAQPIAICLFCWWVFSPIEFLGCSRGSSRWLGVKCRSLGQGLGLTVALYTTTTTSHTSWEIYRRERELGKHKHIAITCVYCNHHHRKKKIKIVHFVKMISWLVLLLLFYTTPAAAAVK